MVVTGRPVIVSGMVTAPPGAGVSRDRDRAVNGRISELGLYCCGHGQQRRQKPWCADRVRGLLVYEIRVTGIVHNDLSASEAKPRGGTFSPRN